MPGGLWLVPQGSRNHHILPIESWDAKTEPIEVSKHDSGTLAMALDDAPLVQAEIFDGGESRRMMREVVVEIVASGPPTRFRIVHSDAVPRVRSRRADAGREFGGSGIDPVNQFPDKRSGISGTGSPRRER